MSFTCFGIIVDTDLLFVYCTLIFESCLLVLTRERVYLAWSHQSPEGVDVLKGVKYTSSMAGVTSPSGTFSRIFKDH